VATVHQPSGKTRPAAYRALEKADGYHTERRTCFPLLCDVVTHNGYQAGFFSVVVSIFLVTAIGELRPNSSELLLAQISLQIAQPPTAAFSPPINILFAPPTKLDIAVNALWALSLALCLTSTLGAILVQEWIQEYLCYSKCHNTPSTRARIRAYLFNGISGHRLDQVISSIPLLLHLAILLFGAGMTAYFFAFNTVVAYTALVAYSTAGTLYLFFTISPLISLSSPFKTPISNVLWRMMQLIWLTALHITQRVISITSPHSILCFRLHKMISASQERYRGGIVRALEQDLETTSSNMDADSLRWAISSMQDDDALESFIAAIPQFLDTEHHNYPQYTIGTLLEDPDVRLGWHIGRLLRTCAGSSHALEAQIRKRRAITCARAVWYLTEKFSSISALYWDTLFGEETADALSVLMEDPDISLALIARCTASLAALACLREIVDFTAWTQTKGPQWANRARHLAGYVVKLSGISFPVDPENMSRDGPLHLLGAFLADSPFGIVGGDMDMLFMVNTTVKHLADGVRAGEATSDTQKQVLEVFTSGMYGCWERFLDPATSRTVRNAVAGLHPDLVAQIPGDGEAADHDAGFAQLQGHPGYGIISPQRRYTAAWYPYGSPGKTFPRDPDSVSHKSSPRSEPCHSPQDGSSQGTVVEVPPSSMKICHDHCA